MPLVNVERSGPTVALTLNRPEARNALSGELCDEIVAALDEIDGDTDARVLVIRGEGKAFCAGADFGAVSEGKGVDFQPSFGGMLDTVAGFRLPTIAQIHGAALGGGLQLATVCDFRLASDTAKLGIPSGRLGILVNFENVQRLVLLAGIAVAKEVFMTSRRYSGEEAVAAGLVNRAVPEVELPAAVAELASTIGEMAPLSVQGVKRSIGVVAEHLGGARRADPAAVAEIDDLVAQAYASEDLSEGLAAMAEKRSPDFKGR